MIRRACFGFFQFRGKRVFLFLLWPRRVCFRRRRRRREKKKKKPFFFFYLPPPPPPLTTNQPTNNSSGTYFCVDKSVTAVVIKGLAEHKDELGAPLCPCRHYDDKAAEAAQGFWNCPCVPMRERKECHCMLFLTEDNDFRGEDAEITLEEVISATEGMSGTS